MAGTGSTRGGFGWVILVVALAVPGVLFYNWWSHLKAEREKTVAAKARGRVPEGGVFQSSPNAKLVNPMTPAVSSGTTMSIAESTTTVQPGLAADTSAQMAAPSPVVAMQTPVVSSTTVLVPALKRDPTLSPFDQVRIREAEDAKIRAAEELERISKSKGRGPRARAAVRPETLVNLQGIVSNPDSGFKAIVNDEVLGAGEYIGSTKIKIVKISDLGVTFEYQGKKFSKGVSRD